VRYLIHKSRMTFAVMKAGRVLFAQRHTDWTNLSAPSPEPLKLNTSDAI
jgi:hypothetical protein